MLKLRRLNTCAENKRGLSRDDLPISNSHLRSQLLIFWFWFFWVLFCLVLHSYKYGDYVIPYHGIYLTYHTNSVV
jgi:hypothetical protein